MKTTRGNDLVPTPVSTVHFRRKSIEQTRFLVMRVPRSRLYICLSDVSLPGPGSGEQTTGIDRCTRGHTWGVFYPRVFFFSKIKTNCDNGIKTNFGRPRSRPDNNFVTYKLDFHANGPHLSRTIKLQRRKCMCTHKSSYGRRPRRAINVHTYPHINVYYFERFKKDRSLCRSKSRLRLRAGPGRAAACVHAAL